MAHAARPAVNRQKVVERENANDIRAPILNGVSL
tara:strand:+ start:223 stop:324 length:102 start_codon:yes stop_codon:yes gene_type:complete